MKPFLSKLSNLQFLELHNLGLLNCEVLKLETTNYLGKKNAPVKVEGNLMFSQRNNPYCDLLQENKIIDTFHLTKFFLSRRYNAGKMLTFDYCKIF